MDLIVRKPFEKDILALQDKKLTSQVLLVIRSLENCTSLSEIRNIKKMKGRGNYFRIRVGNYRLGLQEEANKLVLQRFLHRKDIYTFFP